MKKLPLPLDNKIELNDLDHIIPKVLWEQIFNYFTDFEQFIFNRLSIFYFKGDSQYLYTDNICLDASRHGLVECLKYAVKHYECDLRAYFERASLWGYMDIINYIVNIDKDILEDTEFLSECLLCCVGGSMKMVKFLCENGAEIRESTIDIASHANDIDNIKYLHSRGGKLTKDSLICAIRNSDSELMSLAYQEISMNDDELNEMTNLAIETKSIKFLKEFFGIYVQINNDSLISALATNLFDIIKEVFEQYDGKIDDDTFCYAVEHCNLKIIKYLFKSIGMCYKFIFNKALERGNKKIITYLKKLGVRDF